jgi:DNA modification methylase
MASIALDFGVILRLLEQLTPTERVPLMSGNCLYYGDNLDVLRRYIPDESVDLVYLDPPFNSNQDYNVLFAERSGTAAAAQIKAFEDTWKWDQTAALAFQEAVESGGDVSQALQAFRTFIGESDMLAYLSMMAPRLVELRRVLKRNGSLYLHCDPTASHYLKMLLDAVFGPQQFRSEVIWKRTSAHASAKRWGPVHDTLLHYSKTDNYTWNQVYQPLPQETIDQWYNNVEPETGRRFNRADLTAAGIRRGPSGMPWRGIDPTTTGRHWAIPGFVKDVVDGLETQEALDALDAAGRLFWPARKGGKPMLKRYLEESRGVPAVDVISDISPLKNMTLERLGYPTQKPEALLERIIAASSNPGDVVLDPFCGCGTAVAAAQKMDRHWIGIDITHLAISLIKARLIDAFGAEAAFKVIGEPVSVEDAATLAAEDPYQFQFWALGLVGARPVEQKKGPDKGIDGRLYFHDEPGGKTKQVIISVKAGHVAVGYVRDLIGVLTREKAEIGVLISMEPPTGPMRKEAASAGFYTSPWGSTHPKVQLLTVQELLSGKGIDLPKITGSNVTLKKAPRATKKKAKQGDLGI